MLTSRTPFAAKHFFCVCFDTVQPLKKTRFYIRQCFKKVKLAFVLNFALLMNSRLQVELYIRGIREWSREVRLPLKAKLFFFYCGNLLISIKTIYTYRLQIPEETGEVGRDVDLVSMRRSPEDGRGAGRRRRGTRGIVFIEQGNSTPNALL